MGHDGDPVVCNGQGHAVQALPKQRPGSDERGVLLGPIVAADPPGEGSELDPFSAGEHNGPEPSGAGERFAPSESSSASGSLGVQDVLLSATPAQAGRVSGPTNPEPDAHPARRRQAC
jgi:hypothetical protein